MEAQCVGKCDDVASAGRLMGPEGPPTSPLNAPVAERRPCRSSSQITKRCGFSLRHLRVGTLVQRFRHDCAQPKVHAAFNPKEPVLRSCRRFLAASTRLRRVWHDVRAFVRSRGYGGINARGLDADWTRIGRITPPRFSGPCCGARSCTPQGGFFRVRTSAA